MIREAKAEDFPYIKEISELTWEGHDYLAKVFFSWLEDGNFYVIEENRKVVGTAKLTILPCGVGWLEGLRVHPKYRGRGFAKRLHEFMISLANELISVNTLMYATYFKNEASIRLGLKYGFKVFRRFYQMVRDPKTGVRPRTVALKDLPDIDPFPLGWLFLRKCEDTLNWTSKRVDSYAVDDAIFFHPKEPPMSFTLLRYNEKTLLRVLDGMNYVAREMGRNVNLMIPENMPHLVKLLRERGFKQWEDGEPDVLIFELKLRPR